jgi:hypothetical protein
MSPPTSPDQWVYGLATAEFLPSAYPCQYDPSRRWDGWYVAYFNLATGLQIAQDLKGLRYDDVRDCFVWPDTLDGKSYLPVTLGEGDSAMAYYPIGAEALFWSCSRQFRLENGTVCRVLADGRLSVKGVIVENLAALGGEVDLMDDE